MSSHSPALGETLLALPEPWVKAWREAAPKAPPKAPADIHQRLSQAHSNAREQALAGEEIFRVVVALQDSVVHELLPSALSSFTSALHSPPPDAAAASDDSAFEGGGSASTQTHAGAGAERTIADSDDLECVAALRAQAVSLVAAGDIGGAITVLCALLDWPSVRDDALLGLAICAVRLDRHDDALALALDYLKRGGTHPRAHCIVGVCHLRKGDKRAAQNHLARAARAARTDPAFRDELRAAQRLLIVLNFGH